MHRSRRPAYPATEAAETMHHPPAPENTPLVLLVEDDESVRAVSRHILLRQGYTVLEAANGAEALATCDRMPTSIDLVISDMVMPELSGPQLGRLIRERHPAISILLMSGYTHEAALRQSFLDADTAFIEKPFTPRAFVARVREVLDARAHEAAARKLTPSRA